MPGTWVQGEPKILYGKDLGRRGSEKRQIVGYQRVVKDGLWELGKFKGIPALDNSQVVEAEEKKAEAAKKRGVFLPSLFSPSQPEVRTKLTEAVVKAIEPAEDQVFLLLFCAR